MEDSSRFIFNLNKCIKTDVKIRAAKRGISMGHWVAQAIIERIKREERYEEKNEDETPINYARR